jgi:hypothetical protein
MTGGWALYNNEYQLFDVLQKITSEYSIIASLDVLLCSIVLVFCIVIVLKFYFWPECYGVFHALQANSAIVLDDGHNHFLPQSYAFIVYNRLAIKCCIGGYVNKTG